MSPKTKAALARIQRLARTDRADALLRIIGDPRVTRAFFDRLREKDGELRVDRRRPTTVGPIVPADPRARVFVNPELNRAVVRGRYRRPVRG